MPVPYLSRECFALLQQQASFDAVSLLEEHFAQEIECLCSTLLMSHLPTECKALLEQHLYFSRIALGDKEYVSQYKEREGDTFDVPQRSEERQGLLFERDGSGIFSLDADYIP